MADNTPEDNIDDFIRKIWAEFDTIDFYNSHKWPISEYSKPYKAVLPFKVHNKPGSIWPSRLFIPRFGYLRPGTIDVAPRFTEVAHQMVIPIDVATRIVWEEMWKFQSVLTANILVDIAKGLGFTIGSSGLSIFNLFAGKPIALLVQFARIIVSELQDFRIDATLEITAQTISARFKSNALPDAEGRNVVQRYEHIIKKAPASTFPNRRGPVVG